MRQVQWETLLQGIKTTEEINTDLILKARGIKNKETFLEPTSEHENNPFTLRNMHSAVEITISSIKNGAKIGVLFDVDCDGICSGTTVTRYLRGIEGNFTVEPMINKYKMHGLSGQPYDKLKKFDLIIACDSGSNEFDLYESLYSEKTKIVLLDHHKAEYYSQHAITVNSEMGNYKNPYLSGSGVAYKFIQAMDEKLGISNAHQYLDLCATGIIGDVMDMTSLENRYLCIKGMENLNNPAIRKILGSYKLNGDSIRFSIAPLINAIQRSGENRLAMDMFLSDNSREILRIIRTAKQFKEEQKSELERYYTDIIEDFSEDDKFVIGMCGNQGITGILAGRLSSETQRPAIVLREDLEVADGELCFIGSIRAVGVESFKDIINETKLATAKGHDNSAGIYIPCTKIEDFKKALSESMSNYTFKSVITADFETKPNYITKEIAEKINRLNRITGKNFPTVSCVLRNITPDFVTKMKNHSKLTCGNLEIIMWNNEGLADAFDNPDCISADILGNISLGFFKGKYSPQIIVQDYIINDSLLFDL